MDLLWKICKKICKRCKICGPCQKYAKYALSTLLMEPSLGLRQVSSLAVAAAAGGPLRLALAESGRPPPPRPLRLHSPAAAAVPVRPRPGDAADIWVSEGARPHPRAWRRYNTAPGPTVARRPGPGRWSRWWRRPAGARPRRSRAGQARTRHAAIRPPSARVAGVSWLSSTRRRARRRALASDL